jgi:hypothetical protein
MRVFIERFILSILAPLVVLLATNPIGYSWPLSLRIIGIIVIVVVAGIAAYFAGWDEWRWERLRGLWWLWSIFGLSGGVALALWLTPLLIGPPTISVTLQSQVATLNQQLSATAQERDELRRKLQASPQPQIKAVIDLDQYSRKKCFDYSANNGVVKVTLNAITFEIHFSKGSKESIHVYKDGTNLRAIASLRGVNPGDDIDFSAFDSSSRVYTVSRGGYFIAQNVDGYFILSRILSIKDDTRGDANDEVCFAYSIDTSKSGKFKAL